VSSQYIYGDGWGDKSQVGDGQGTDGGGRVGGPRDKGRKDMHDACGFSLERLGTNFFLWTVLTVYGTAGRRVDVL